MATITIKDLPANHALDRRAMASIRGGGAPWVFGWIRPHNPNRGSFGSAANFFQVNNYFVEQMINQVQVVDIDNAAPNSNINVVLNEEARNFA